MPIIQEAFDIPVDIAMGIATGKLRRIGGVVRVAQGAQKGQIVKHLKPVSVESSSGVSAITKMVKANKKTIIIAGVIVVIIAGGVAIYSVVNSKESKEMRIFRERFDDYITAVRNGTIDFVVVDQLHKALLDLKELSKNKEIKFQLTPEEVNTIIQQIARYTERLIDLNEDMCSVEDQYTSSPESANVFDLTKYLEIQKRIITEAS